MNDDLNIYNKINEYTQFSDILSEEIDSNLEITSQQKEEMLYPILNKIKNLVEKLTFLYIEYLKDKNNEDIKNKLNTILDNIILEIENFKNTIYDIYMMNNKN